MEFRWFRFQPRHRCVATSTAPLVAPRTCVHTLRSVPLANGRRASPHCLSLSPLHVCAVSSHRAPDLRALLHSRVRCSTVALPPRSTRYFLGLWSSSRFSLHPECSVEHSRGVAVVTVRPWVSPLGGGSLDVRSAIAVRAASSACPPQSTPFENAIDDAVMRCTTRRPADLRQPAIGVFESAFRTLLLLSAADSDGILRGKRRVSKTSPGKSGVGFTRLHTAACTRGCSL